MLGWYDRIVVHLVHFRRSMCCLTRLTCSGGKGI